jgi:N-acetylmuramic acid 6-phosphate etherase
LDASECPPTFGVPHDLVIGLIAGGDSAIRKAVEFAEDDNQQGWKDLEFYNINSIDIVVGIAAEL